MINISGPGIPKPIVQIWESQDKVHAQPPASFEFQVPRGENRIIQVLAITRDFYFVGDQFATSGNETFFYGDVTKTLANPVETVEIALQEISLGEGGEGVISGRWIGADGNGPTGIVTMKYVPPNAPPMVVHRAEIHGGWFEFPAIAGGKFSYEFEDGTPLITNFDIGNPGLTWNDERLWIKVPAGYKNIYGFGPSPVARRETSPANIVLGYFGPGASGKKVCYPDETFKLSGLYTSPDLSLNTEVEWSTSGPSATKAGVVNGGAPESDCETSGSWFNDWLVPRRYSFLDGGRKIAGFRGVFQPLNESPASEEKIVEATYNTNTNKVDLSWKYLPGATGPGRVTGLEIFTRVVPEGPNSYPDDLYDGDGIACNQLMNPMYFPLLPFTSRGRFAVQGTDPQTVSFSGLTEEEFDRAQIILCPFSDERPGYFTAGYIHYNYSFGGGGPFKEIRLSLVNAISNYNNVRAHDCEEVKITFYQDGAETVVEDDLGVQLSEASSTSFYTDASCYTSPVTEATIPAGSSSTTLYWISQTSGIYYLHAWTDTIGGRAQRVAVTDPYGYSATKLKIEFEEGGEPNDTHHYIIGGCYPIAINLYGAYNTLNNDQSLTVDIVHTGPGKLYDQPDCQGPELSTLNFPVNVASKIVFLKPEGVAGQVYEIKALSSGLSDSNIWKYDVAAATITRLETQLQDQPDNEIAIYSANPGCFKAYVQPKAANGALLPFPSPMTATVTIIDGTFLLSKDSQCTNPSSAIQVHLAPYNPNGRSEPFWIKVVDPGRVSGTVSASISSPNINTQSTLFRDPTLEITGIGGVIVKGLCYPITINLKSADGALLSVPPGKSVSVTASINSGELYTDGQCSSGANYHPVLFSNGSSSASLWVRAFGSGATVSSALNAISMIQDSKSVTVAELLLGAVVNSGSSFANNDTCVPFQIVVSPSNLPESIEINSLAISGTVVQPVIYKDNTCTIPEQKATIGASQTFSNTLYFAPQPGLSSGTYSIMFNGVYTGSNYNIYPSNSQVSASCSGGVCATQPN